MHVIEISTFVIYFLVLISISFFSYRKQKSDTEFVIGNRSLNFWLTALSAHASDMSNWLFMGYPALIFTTGIFNIWAAIGLIVFMFLNWQFIAPKIRTFTEKKKNLTLNSYFETIAKDKSGAIRTISAIISLVFFTFYLSAGLIGLGFLTETLFSINYIVGISIGLLIVVFYVLLGGYNTVAIIDLFQGLFLLLVILIMPIYLIYHIGGFPKIYESLLKSGLSTSLFPDFSFSTIFKILMITCGWGLGYFGQPHIITKFMGIKNVKDINKAKYVGISWQTLSLLGATLFGIIGIYFFTSLPNPELVILEIVKDNIPVFFAALVLCAILAATTNVMAAQILVVASSLSEDIYKRFIKKDASHLEVLKISRICVILVAILAYIVAFFKISSIYTLVLYSWSGIGAAFGPILLISLYIKKIPRLGIFLGILIGSITSGIFPLINTFIPPLIPGFLLSSTTILISCFLKKRITNGKKVKYITN